MFKVPAWLIFTIIFIGLFIAFFYLLTFFETKKKKEKLDVKKFYDVTFIIPAYNASTYIEKTINSIMELDYPKKKLKIFVVDDGSQDNTAEKVKKLMKKYTNIRLFKKRKEGKAAALNFGIGKVKTELIAVLDSDTILQKDILKKAVALLSQKKIVAVTSRLVPLNKKGFFARMQVVEYSLTSFFRKLLSNINALPIAPAFTVYKTFFFKKYGGFDRDNLTEDFEIALRIHFYGYDILYILDSYAETIVPSKFRQLYRQRVRWGYGTLYNIRKYKHMVFSLKYGDLGTFLLPNLVIGIIVIVLILAIAIYNIIVGVIRSIKHIMLGWIPIIDINLFAIVVLLSDSRVLLGIIGLAVSLFFLFLIRKESNIRISILDYILYVTVYIWLLAYFRIISIIKFFSKKPTW